MNHKLQRLYRKHSYRYGNEYRTFRNFVKETIRDARDMYYRESLERREGISKCLWLSVINILHHNQTSGIQGSLDYVCLEISDEL